MILPLPVALNVREPLRFINLENCPSFFERLWRAFHPPGQVRGDDLLGGNDMIDVEQVGDYVASFVPSVADFSRIAPVFRLSDQTWEQIPVYKDFGFAVFQLKPGKQKPHPMAFEFARRDENRLFFPTIHIHDGKVHANANFDHRLYCQRLQYEQLDDWSESPTPAENIFSRSEMTQAGGLLEGTHHVYARRLIGALPNQDIIV